MSTRPSPAASSERKPRSPSLVGPYRLVWACLSVMLILSGAVLFFLASPGGPRSLPSYCLPVPLQWL